MAKQQFKAAYMPIWESWFHEMCCSIDPNKDSGNVMRGFG